MKAVRIPKNQVLWETYRDENCAVRYAVTSDALRQKYTLFKVDGEKTEKVAQADSPVKLYPLMDNGRKNTKK